MIPKAEVVRARDQIIRACKDHITGNSTRRKEERQTEEEMGGGGGGGGYNIKEWTGLELSDTLRKAESREEWMELVANTPVVPIQSMTMGQLKVKVNLVKQHNSNFRKKGDFLPHVLHRRVHGRCSWGVVKPMSPHCRPAGWPRQTAMPHGR